MAGKSEVSFTVRVIDAGSAALKEVGKTAEETLGKLLSFKDVLAGMARAIEAFAIGEVIKDIIELGIASDKTFRLIAAVLPTAAEGIKELKENIEDLAQVSGRSLEEMQQSAASIAKMGVSGAEEVKQVLEAATLLADGTGTSVDESSQLLITLRREFHLTGDEALDTAAKLASISRGKIGVNELQGAFLAAQPVFQKFGIDADTGIRAISALLQTGRTTARALRQELNNQTADGIRYLAGQVPIASDALDRLNEQANITRGGVDRLNQQIKNDFIKSLESVGTKLMEVVNPGLKGLALWADQIGGKQSGVKEFFASVIDGLDNTAARFKTGDTANALKQLFGIGRTGGGLLGMLGLGGSNEKTQPPTMTWQTIDPNRELDKPGIITPPGKDQIAAWDEAAKKLRELRTEATSLGEQTLDSKSKSEQMADAIRKWGEQAYAAAAKTRDAKASIAEVTKTLIDLNDKAGNVEAAEKLKASKDAAKAFGDVMASISSDPLTQFDQKVRDTTQSLQAEIDKLKAQGNYWQDRSKDLRDYTAAMRDVRAAIVETSDDTKQLTVDQQQLSSGGMTLDQINAMLDKYANRMGELQQEINASTNPEQQKQYQAQLDKDAQFVDQLFQEWEKVGASTTKTQNNLKGLVDAYAAVGRSIIAAAQAMGQMDDKTAAALQNLVSLGTGIAEIFSGVGTAQGIAQSAASLGGLIASLIPKHETDEQRASREQGVIEAMNRLSNELSGLTDSLDQRLQQVQSEYASARQTIESNLAGKKHQTEREQDLAQLNAEEAKRIEQVKEQFALDQQQAQEDYRVAELRAEGKNAEADALENAEKAAREYAAAVKAGDDADTLAALAAKQKAEAVQQAQKAANDKLNDALTLVGEQLQIGHTSDPLAIFGAKAKAYAGAGGALGDLLGGFDLAHLTPDDIKAIDDKLKDLFTTLTNPDTAGSVDTAGLSIQDLITAILGLDSAATDAGNAVESAAQKMQDAENALNTSFDILGTDATGQAQALAKLYGFDLGDISTAQGRDAAIAALQKLYQANSGDAQMAQQIANTIHALRNIQYGGGAGGTDSVSGISLSSVSGGNAIASANSFTTATGTQADRMLDFQLREVNLLTDIRNILSQSVSLPSFSPVNIGSALGIAAGGGIHIDELNLGGIQVHTASDDPEAIALAVQTEFRRDIDQWFGRAVDVQRTLNGNITVSPS